MFKITTFDFSKKNFNDWKLEYDYHCVYILENGKDAYIGETANIIKRARKHNRSLKNRKYKFNSMHVITGEHAEATPAKHYENLLIKLMKIDNRFNIINRNKGNKYIFYKRKNRFELYFDELWFELEKKGLVSTKDFKTFINSGIFKFSPYTTLNREQKKAFTAAINVLSSGETLPITKKYKGRPILINGSPGTGKTLVAIMIFYYLRNNEQFRDKKVTMVVPNPSMRNEIQSIFSELPNLHKCDVISPTKLSYEKYDIIICDEAHKLRRRKNLLKYSKAFSEANKRLGLDNTHDELDWILKQSKYQILFYDKNQIISPTEIPNKSFERRLNDKYQGIRPIKLKKQERIQAGKGYVKFIRDILYENCPKKRKMYGYDFKIVEHYRDLVKIINEKNTTYGLSCIASGYSFQWKNDGTDSSYDICIDNVITKWNKKTTGWIRSENSKDEVGSVYTLCGMDLNYAGIVIGPEVYYDKTENKIKIDKDKFYDNIVKTNVSNEELKNFILNSYLILLTRSIKGTYIYICDKDLRDYFKQFID